MSESSKTDFAAFNRFYPIKNILMQQSFGNNVDASTFDNISYTQYATFLGGVIVGGGVVAGANT
jgi:hypothetical protein